MGRQEGEGAVEVRPGRGRQRRAQIEALGVQGEEGRGRRRSVEGGVERQQGGGDQPVRAGRRLRRGRGVEGTQLEGDGGANAGIDEEDVAAAGQLGGVLGQQLVGHAELDASPQRRVEARGQLLGQRGAERVVAAQGAADGEDEERGGHAAHGSAPRGRHFRKKRRLLAVDRGVDGGEKRGVPKEPLRPYDQRIQRAIDHIERVIDGHARDGSARTRAGDRDLSLSRLAQVAGISPFHFHRVFSALTGESVLAMTTRRRLERALALTQRGQRPQWKAVALDVGYRSPDVFRRAFQRQFGCTPAQFDLERWWSERPDADAARAVSRHFLRPAPPLPADFPVEIVRRPAAERVACRVVGGYLQPDKLIAAYGRVREAAAALGVALPGRLAGASPDDPELTPLARCRYDFALEVPAGTKPPAGLFASPRPAGRWAQTHVAGDMAAVDRAWNLLWKSWLPASRCDLRGAPAEEIYHRTPEEIGWERFDLTLAIPLED